MTAATHDALGRRRRERRVPTGKCLRPTSRALIWLEALARHGPLPSTYLHAYTAHRCRNAAWARRALTDLFHEASVHGPPYLDRPWQQFATIDARHNDLVYAITDAGHAALADAGRPCPHPAAPGGPWLHRHMVACLTASIELATRARADLRFIGQDAITAQPLRTALSAGQGSGAQALVPDALFALAYRTQAGERFRLFALEADRATEPARGRAADRKTVRRMAEHYRDYVGGGRYKHALGVSAPMLVLTVTTSAARLATLIDTVAATAAAGRNAFMLFRHVPAFGRYYKPPKPLPELLERPWCRAGCAPFRIDQV